MRQLKARAEKPILGAVLARRSIGILGTAEELAIRIPQVIREAGWERIAIGEVLGDGASWIWKVADTHFPSVRQTPDYYHLSEHFYAVANFQYPNNPTGAKAWVDQKLGALLIDRLGEVLSGLKRMWHWKKPSATPWPADRLCGTEPDSDQIPTAPAERTRCGVRCHGGGLHVCHSKSFQAGGYALEAARLSPHLGLAARKTQWELPGILG
jgi:hypothetical protein